MKRSVFILALLGIMGSGLLMACTNDENDEGMEVLKPNEDDQETAQLP